MSRSVFLASLAALVAGSGLAVASGAFAAANPAVATGSASAIGDSGASVAGSVNPNGQATTYAFEYGTSVHYTEQTAVQSAGAGTAAVNASAQLKDLTPGTTYHFRIIASNGAGTTAGGDATFKTTGIAPPVGVPLQTSTGAASAVEVDSAKLSGTITPAGAHAGETVLYYFQLGPGVPYALQTVQQTLTAGSAPVAVSATVTGLASMTSFHYRLIAINEAGQVSSGADQTFTTLPKSRLVPTAVRISASPTFQRRIPDRVTVSGKLVPPPQLSDALACRGYFDITFRVGQIAIQSLRAGIHPDCTFSLPVVFHNRRRLMGGHMLVHVLFAGNRFLHRLEAPPASIQVG
jgi:phosphodiesterase/alkaline phosphatase D-like protein